MKLTLFTEDTRNEWLGMGHDKVKITGSAHLSVNDLPEKDFVLLEPWNDDLPDSLDDGDLAEHVTSPVVDEIIRSGTGRYYH